ncbi:cobalamin biosynthesis protein CobQ [Haloprofundus marisrubri]|uniref:Probable cobyric acid synthase n=1 Tax=Haloprofundus marisrubri TaxID=1514971 RepID=A0A0W1RDF1_9EURY|nr:cobyric acid synthase [Haloprofundus marisrubri]KTG11068.1 cobalamin biosynthesis protein CobQ [Haloprofundus marisrubri]
MADTSGSSDTSGTVDTARTLLVAGTASHVGKSTVAAGLCRHLSDRGVSVAPFKAQNMSNNARAVPRSPALDGSEAFGEVGVSQFVQARAARVAPTTDHNPVLLKPRGDGESQLVVDGVAVGHFAAGNYYDEHWNRARDAAEAAHARLAADREVVVAEGAGSIAEINLHHRDLANVETTRFADADVLLVADIERGGVFASLVGTLELVPTDLRDRVVGAVITKFRGDVSLLDPGLDAFEERTGVPILGVLPYDDPGLPEEDSVSLPAEGDRAVIGDDDGVASDSCVTIAVPRLPRASNVTDLEPLAGEPGVRVAYVPLTDDLSHADAVVLPGTKNTVDDLLALQKTGFDDALSTFDGPVVGLCGGYQMLGERITNTGVESAAVDASDEIEGFGLLPVETVFSTDKRVEQSTLSLRGTGPLDGADGDVSGYEIHAGETHLAGDADAASIETPFSRNGDASAALGVASQNVLGTYLHGLFENESAKEAFVTSVFASARRTRPETVDDDDHDRRSPYDRAAALVADHVDLAALGFPA